MVVSSTRRSSPANTFKRQATCSATTVPIAVLVACISILISCVAAADAKPTPFNQHRRRQNMDGTNGNDNLEGTLKEAAAASVIHLFCAHARTHMQQCAI